MPLYQADSVHKQLDTSTTKFVNTSVSFARKGRDVVITLPKICQWFMNDFGNGTNDVLLQIRSFLSAEKQEMLKELWNERKGCYEVGIFNVRWLPFNFECRLLTLEK